MAARYGAGLARAGSARGNLRPVALAAGDTPAWVPGDTAVCIRDDWEVICPGYRCVGDEPRIGARLTVSAVGISRATRQPAFLIFEPRGAAFEVEAFARHQAQECPTPFKEEHW